MKKLILYFAILSVSICIPALSHAAPVLENYSGTVSGFHTSFTYVNPATSKLKTVAINAAAAQGVKNNAEISRETTLNVIGTISPSLIFTRNDHGLVMMAVSNLALTSASGVTMSNVDLIFYTWDGTAKYDPIARFSGTGNVYACATGGFLTFVPVNNGANAVLKITEITPWECTVIPVVGGVEETEIPAMATVTLPAVTMKKFTP